MPWSTRNVECKGARPMYMCPQPANLNGWSGIFVAVALRHVSRPRLCPGVWAVQMDSDHACRPCWADRKGRCACRIRRQPTGAPGTETPHDQCRPTNMQSSAWPLAIIDWVVKHSGECESTRVIDRLGPLVHWARSRAEGCDRANTM